MDTMGTVYTGLGLYPTAIPLMRESLRKRRVAVRRHDGRDRRDARAPRRGADAERRLRGSLRSACEDALAIQRKVLGNTHADVANTLSALADVMSFTGEYDKGQPLIEEALRIRRASYGEMHPDVAKSLGDLGVNFGERGDFKQAEVYLRQALEQQRKLHDGLHPDLAEAMNNLAWALQKPRRIRRGRAALSRVAVASSASCSATRIRSSPPGSTTSRSCSRRAATIAARRQAYRESLEMNRKLLGDSHPEIALGMSNLAFVLYAKGDRAGAIRMMRESHRDEPPRARARSIRTWQAAARASRTGSSRRANMMRRRAARRSARDPPQSARLPTIRRSPAP